MFNYSILMLVLCSGLQISNAAPVNTDQAYKEAMEKLAMMNADFDELMGKATKQKEVLETISQDALQLVTDSQNAISGVADDDIKQALGTVAQDAQKLVEDAKNAIAIISQATGNKVNDALHSGGDALHNAIERVNSAAQKVVDASNIINQKVHQIVGNTVGKVPGGQKIVGTSEHIYQNVHKLVGNSVGKVTGGAHKVVDSVTGGANKIVNKITGVLSWNKSAPNQN